jgi:hypothetical protein
VAIFSGSVRAWEVLTPCRVGLGAVLKNLTELKKSKVAESDVCTFFMNSTDFSMNSVVLMSLEIRINQSR